jgi:hypothetical protein
MKPRYSLRPLFLFWQGLGPIQWLGVGLAASSFV